MITFLLTSLSIAKVWQEPKALNYRILAAKLLVDGNKIWLNPLQNHEKCCFLHLKWWSTFMYLMESAWSCRSKCHVSLDSGEQKVFLKTTVFSATYTVPREDIGRPVTCMTECARLHAYYKWIPVNSTSISATS